MEAVSYIFKVSLPHYLQSLPIPESFSGFVKLGYFDWVSLALFFHVVLLAVVAVVKLFLPKPPSKVNVDIKKEDPKVVDLVDVEDLSKEKVSYCRCWRSKEFPLCDGSHNDHNKNTRDNVGPLVIKCKKRK